MKSYHMTADEFRRCGHELVDWIADYRSRVEDLPVLSQSKPGELRAALPEHAPDRGESFDDILADIDRLIVPGITHWQSPNFFAYFPSNSSEPAILGELLSAGLGVQGMIWATSPACTELETHVLDWLVDMLDLPDFFKSSSTGAVLSKIQPRARPCALFWPGVSARATGEPTVSGSKAPWSPIRPRKPAHSSIEKAVKIAGIGAQNLRLIDVDEAFAMQPEALARQIAADRDQGLTPFFVCATVGTTSSNAMDPLPAIGRICRKEDLWLHVDAAMSGTAALSPEYRFIHDGVEHADSYCFNPHKWMFTTFDCDCFYVKSRKDLIDTLSILPEYLRNEATESGAVIDYRDWHIPARAPVPRSQALVRHSPLRNRRPETPRFATHRASAPVRELGRS